MDKLQMVIQLILNAIRSGNVEDIGYYFDLAENIEKEAIERFYIEKVHCEKCNALLKKHDLDGQYRIECDCRHGIGVNYKEAYQDWNK